MNMLYLSSIIAIFFLSLLFNGYNASRVSGTPRKYVTMDGCKCEGLKCNCCVGIDLTSSPHHEVCLTITVIPKEITLKAVVSVDGNQIYSGQLDPGLVPICLPPLPEVCLSINHVDLQKREVCTKLSIAFFTLVKFPCITRENGTLATRPNTYR